MISINHVVESTPISSGQLLSSLSVVKPNGEVISSSINTDTRRNRELNGQILPGYKNPTFVFGILPPLIPGSNTNEFLLQPLPIQPSFAPITIRPSSVAVTTRTTAKNTSTTRLPVYTKKTPETTKVQVTTKATTKAPVTTKVLTTKAQVTTKASTTTRAPVTARTTSPSIATRPTLRPSPPTQRPIAPKFIPNIPNVLHSGVYIHDDAGLYVRDTAGAYVKDDRGKYNPK